jgi:hypothetical protein
MHNPVKSILCAVVVSLMVIGAGGCVRESSDSAGPSANTSGLVINEIVVKASAGGEDWVELYNAGDGPVSLSDYSLMDDNGFRDKTQLPDEDLAPGEFIVLLAVDDAPLDGSYYVPFKLAADDVLTLYKGNRIVDTLDWEDGDVPEESSYGRFPDGMEDYMMLTPTPGEENG